MADFKAKRGWQGRTGLQPAGWMIIRLYPGWFLKDNGIALL